MSGEKIWWFDTTLRDGGQTRGVDFSRADKLAIAHLLDDIGIDYIEGGWPGANPTDDAFFANYFIGFTIMREHKREIFHKRQTAPSILIFIKFTS